MECALRGRIGSWLRQTQKQLCVTLLDASRIPKITRFVFTLLYRSQASPNEESLSRSGKHLEGRASEGLKRWKLRPTTSFRNLPLTTPSRQGPYEIGQPSGQSQIPGGSHVAQRTPRINARLARRVGRQVCVGFVGLSERRFVWTEPSM